MVLARGSRLMDLPGVGPVVAARILADVGDVARFADRNRFASWTGTAPLDASSGGADPAPALPRREPEGQPHDPHRSSHPGPPGHRRPRLLPTQARRRQDPPGGHPLSEAQDLRRRLPPTPPRRSRGRDQDVKRGPGRALRGVSRIQRGRLSPAHRHFGSATSRTRSSDATDVPATPEGRHPHSRLTTEGSRKDALTPLSRIRPWWRPQISARRKHDDTVRLAQCDLTHVWRYHGANGNETEPALPGGCSKGNACRGRGSERRPDDRDRLVNTVERKFRLA